MNISDLDFKYRIAEETEWGEHICIAAYPTPSCRFMVLIPSSSDQITSAMTTTRTWGIVDFDFRTRPNKTLHELALHFIRAGTEFTNDECYIAEFGAQFPAVVDVLEVAA